MATRHIQQWPETGELTKPAKDVARLLGVHPCTIFRWVKSGKIECVRFSKSSIHFTYEQVLDCIDNNRKRVKIRV